MIPFPIGLFAGGILSKPLLNQLSAGTTVIGAWSTARQLKTTATAAFNADKIGTATQDIGFTGGKLDTGSLTTFAAGGSLGVTYMHDQTGNANYLTRPSTSTYCPITTGAGALNASITCAGGFSAPMLSTGYNGLSAGTTGPYLASGSLTIPGNMAVSYGTSSSYWCFVVMRTKSSTGNINGGMTNFAHTGDSNLNTGTGSCVFLERNASTTSGAIYAQHASQFALATMAENTPAVVGAVFNGTTVTMYVNAAAGTPGSCTGSLGSGGVFGVGDWANAGAFGTVPFAGDFAEIITGTTLAAADLTLIQANMKAFYSTP